MLALAGVLLAGVPAQQQLPGDHVGRLRLLNLTTHPFARCMDGTPGGFYVRPAPSGAQRHPTTWVLDFEGGGECTTEANCEPRLAKSVGSSTFFRPNATFNSHFSSADSTQNPDFFDANLVRLKYCSGDLWSGRHTAELSPSGFWFSGHHIVAAIMDELSAELTAATEIVVTGDDIAFIMMNLH